MSRPAVKICCIASLDEARAAISAGATASPRHRLLSSLGSRQPAYAYSEADPTGAEMIRNIEYARANGSQGVVLFAYPYLADNALWDELSTGPFAEAAEPPPITW